MCEQKCSSPKLCLSVWWSLQLRVAERTIWKPTWLLREVTRRFPVNIMWLNTQIKSYFFAVSAATCKAARITNPVPPAETKQRHDQTWNCGAHSVPLCPDSSFIMFHAAFTQGEEIDGFKWDSPLARMVKTAEKSWKSAKMHAALTGMFPNYQSFCKIEFQL